VIFFKYFRQAMKYILRGGVYQQKRYFRLKLKTDVTSGSCHKRQKPQAPTPQALIRNRQTRKVANAKGLNRDTNLT